VKKLGGEKIESGSVVSALNHSMNHVQESRPISYR